jgi:hypothetical protein
MTSDRGITISDADIASTAAKLAAFGTTLSQAEQAVLGYVITQAAQAGQATAEVSGYFTLIELTFNVQGVEAALRGAFGMEGSLLPAVQTPASYQTGGSAHTSPGSGGGAG